MAADVELSGVWASDQRQVLDDKAARKAGLTNPDGTPALHGTYTRLRYVVLTTESIGSDDWAVLVVFDDAGNFMRFVREGTKDPLSPPSGIPEPEGQEDPPPSPPAKPADPKQPQTWIASLQPVTYQLTGDSYAWGLMPRTVFPTLALAKYDEENCPSGQEPGDLYIGSVGDQMSRQALPPVQSITYKPLADTLTWTSQEYRDGLVLSRVNPQEPAPEGAQWSDVFTGQSAYAQMAFPFYGYDPRSMRIESGAGTYFQPGSSGQNIAYPSNSGESFSAPLLFRFPTGGSRDYNRYEDLPHQPNLPIGRKGRQIDTAMHQEHAMMVSKIAERVDSWSLSLGLSAGIGKMLSETLNSTFSSTVENQTKNESRYTIARTVELSWANIIYMPSLQPKEEFSGWIKQLTDDILTGTMPDWDAFVRHFGTHYMHAMTQGSLEYAETRLSLQSEVSAQDKKVDLKSASQGVLDGVKMNVSAQIAEEWKTKNVTGVEKSDIETMSLGKRDQYGVGILYDLRPMTELLNPLLFPYDSGDDWQQRAPWVWSVVRESLSGHLEGLGLNQPLALAAHDDYKPRIVAVTFPNLRVVIDDNRNYAELPVHGPVPDRLFAVGSITIEDAPDPAPPANDLSDRRMLVESIPFQASDDNQVWIHGTGASLLAKDFSCVFALRKGARLRFKLKFDLHAVPDELSRGYVSAQFSGERIFETDDQDYWEEPSKDIAQFPPMDFQTAKGIGVMPGSQDINFTLALSMQLHKLPEFGLSEWPKPSL